MSSTAAEAPPKPPRWSSLSLSTRLRLLATLLVLLLAGMEILARCYWRIARGVPPLGMAKIEDSFFPEWESAGLGRPEEAGDDGAFRVLVLAGSVWNKDFGDLGPRFASALGSRLGRPVRLVNLGFPGRTTLDSLRRYRKLRDRRFDLVVAYHAINDLHLGNCRPSEYRDDYLHAPRFWQLSLLDSHPEHPWLVLPLTLRFLKSRWAEQLHIHRGPGKHGIVHGGDGKTVAAFRSNLEAILDLARQRGEPVALATFATYFPADYSEERFKAKQLDYGSHASPLSFWGNIGTVPPGVAAHNAVIRELAREHGTLFLDLDKSMPRGKAHFNDCCHLAPAGCEEFARALAELVAAGPLARATKEEGR